GMPPSAHLDSRSQLLHVQRLARFEKHPFGCLVQCQALQGLGARALAWVALNALEESTGVGLPLEVLPDRLRGLAGLLVIARTVRQQGKERPRRIVAAAWPAAQWRPKTAAAGGARMTSPSFADLGVSKAVIDALAARGLRTPFPIQTLVLPDALAGRDVLARS